MKVLIFVIGQEQERIEAFEFIEEKIVTNCLFFLLKIVTNCGHWMVNVFS